MRGIYLNGPSGLAILLAIALFSGARFACSQIELVTGDFFPADLEFKELRGLRPDTEREAKTPVPAEDSLFREAGLQNFARRIYETEGNGYLSVEVFTLVDERAAYSMLTLFHRAALVPGPPGESFCLEENLLAFVRGNYFVRIRGTEGGDLLRRVATSVSNRIGPRQRATPSMISNFPETGMDRSSLRYFLGPQSLASLGNKINGFAFLPGMEIAQASYGLRSQAGTLSLVSFPTAQMAEDFFDSISEKLQPDTGRIFSRRVGPIIGILSGGFDAETANEILGKIRFTYTIKWIYDKNSRSSATVWGVPVRILGTVVRSLMLTALLCICSILLGVGIAAFRFFLRDYAPGNYLDRPERTEMIRLRLDEVRVSTPASMNKRDPIEPK